tara:strand:+ start:723 stop:4904 length:4182 start_codon:yes stop_codon:yes gene_type:complete
MARDISISKNHFYVRKDIDVDIELSSSHPDDYSGGSKQTITISNDVEDKMYLFDTAVPSQDKDYNKIDEMHLELYVNTTSSSTSIIPSFLTYPVKNIYSITEGTSELLDKGLSVFTSTLQPDDLPLVKETFDGANKGFGTDDSDFTQPTRIVRAESNGEGYSIKWSDVVSAHNKFGYPKKIISTYYQNNATLNLIGEGQLGGQELFYVEGYENWMSNGIRVRKTLKVWQNRGAFVNRGTINVPNAGSAQIGQDGVKILGAQTFTNAITPKNSIFNFIHKEPSVYDIKVQTLESVGEDEFAFTMNNFDLTSDDSLTDGQSARMHLFWENYSGATSGDAAKSLANCYGQAGGTNEPNMQTMVAAITDIPVARTLDNLRDNLASIYRPEIEIVFKVKQLAPSLRKNNFGVLARTSLGRSVNFIFANKAPNQDEGLWQYWNRMYDSSNPAGSGDGSLFHLCGMVNGATASGSFSLFSAVGNDSGANVVGSGKRVPSIASLDTQYGIEAPLNEWIRMRIRQHTNDGSALAYFPDLPADSDGVVPNIVMSSTFVSAEFGGTNTVVTGLSNFRAVKTSGSTTGSIDHDLDPDLDGGINDRQTEVLIDSISFHGYNHNVENVTRGKLTSTPSASPLEIKSTPVVTNPATAFAFDGSKNDRASKVAKDNFYTQAKTPSPTVVAFGFDSITSLGNKFLQFNNFNSALGAASSSINDVFIKWGYSDKDLNAGPVTAGHLNLTQGTDILTDTEALFVDNFKQKGYLKISGSTAINTAIGGEWVKTTCPYVNCLVLAVSQDGKTIVVDNPEMFDEPLDQDYVAFRQNNSTSMANNGLFNTYAAMNVGSGSVGQKSDDLYQIKPREGNVIFLNRSIKRDDKNAVDMATTTYTTSSSGVSRLLISPKKFWLWGMIQNVAPQAANTRSWGEWYDAPTYSGSTVSPKIYDSVRLYASTGTIGTTYNEFLYNDGSNQNAWDLNYKSTDNILEMSKDYGYGAYKEPSGEEPAVIGGYINKSTVISGSNTAYFDLSRYASVTKLSPLQELKFAVYPELDNAFYYNINFDSAEGSNASRRPNMIYGFNKPLPMIDNLTVSPRFDFLKEDVNINKFTKSNGTDIVFNWQESKDIDYRILFVDTMYIKNKYHRSRFIAQLNESGSTAKYYLGYNALAQGSAFDLTGDANTPDIEGAQGYASKFAGSTQLTQTTNTLRIGADNFTIMATLNPTAKAGDSNLDVALEMSKTTTTDSNFALGVDNANQVQFKVTGSTKLTSTTAYGMIGTEQIGVVITYDKSLDTDNLKLYINGKLEDTADYTTSFETSGRIYIGGDINDANHYSGFIEEISTHSETVYVVINNKQFILPTKSLPDLSSGESNKYQARMFAFDKTNIRGVNRDEVATSNTVSWKVTGVA